MGEVIEVGKFISCNICRKRKATLLCDMPIGRSQTMHVRNLDGTTDSENSFKEYTQTCDREICEKCAIEVNNGIHFCKTCYSKLK